LCRLAFLGGFSRTIGIVQQLAVFRLDIAQLNDGL
jgi:hypothetical protein